MLKRPIILILILLVGCIGLIFPILSPFILVGSLLLVCIYIKPIFGLYLCLTLGFIVTLEMVYGSLTTIVTNHYSLSFIPIILSFGIGIIHHLTAARKGENRDFRIYFFPAVLIIWAMISMLWSLDPYHGLHTILYISVGIAFFILLNNLILNKIDLKKMLRYLVFLSLFLASATLLSKFMVLGFSTEITPKFSLAATLFVVAESMRPGGFAHPSLACATLVFLIFMIIAIYPQVKSRGKILLFLLGIFLLFNVLLTASKAGIASFIVGIFFLILGNPILRKRAISWSSLTITVILSLLIFNFVFLKEERLIGSAGSAAVAEASLTTRLEYWKTGFEMLANRWIGAGAGGFLKVVAPVREAHSTYFSILFDLGIAGFTIFILFIIEAALRLRKAIKECRDESITWTLYCVSASFIALLIHSLVNDFHYFSYFWLVMGLIFVVTRIATETSNQPSPEEVGI